MLVFCAQVPPGRCKQVLIVPRQTGEQSRGVFFRQGLAVCGMKKPEMKADQDQDNTSQALGDSRAEAKGTVSTGTNGEGVIAGFGFSESSCVGMVVVVVVVVVGVGGKCGPDSGSERSPAGPGHVKGCEVCTTVCTVC